MAKSYAIGRKSFSFRHQLLVQMQSAIIYSLVETLPKNKIQNVFNHIYTLLLLYGRATKTGPRYGTIIAVE